MALLPSFRPRLPVPHVLPRRRVRALMLGALALALGANAPSLAALSCTTQAQMTAADRDALVQAARTLAGQVQSGNVAAVRADTVSNVAAQFEGIASGIQQTQPLIGGATLTIDALYGLDASDQAATAEQAQFFCGAADSPLHVEIAIPQLPQGRYALAMLHASGVPHPQQMALVLQNEAGRWKLAGFFVRPLLVAGHDSVWYWTRARAFTGRKQPWNAYFYYSTAAYLAAPVDFLNSPNREKLMQEEEGARPSGLPGAQPMRLQGSGTTYSITDLHPDGSLGGLDLVATYSAADTSDPVATRSRNLEVMRALLQQHPELREGFHGLWVYAQAPNQRPFGIELPMSEIH